MKKKSPLITNKKKVRRKNIREKMGAVRFLLFIPYIPFSYIKNTNYFYIRFDFK